MGRTQMLQDKLLVWKFKRGSARALECIYSKYKNDMLALAFVLSNEKAAAEDAVHDVFVSFARHAGKLQLRTSLKGYLLSSVANRLRSVNRPKALRLTRIGEAENVGSEAGGPDRAAMLAEGSDRIEQAMAQLPSQQREVIILHVHSGMKFREIAKARGVSVSPIHSRYRYGLSKLRSALDGEVEK